MEELLEALNQGLLIAKKEEGAQQALENDCVTNHLKKIGDEINIAFDLPYEVLEVGSDDHLIFLSNDSRIMFCYPDRPTDSGHSLYWRVERTNSPAYSTGTSYDSIRATVLKIIAETPFVAKFLNEHKRRLNHS